MTGRVIGGREGAAATGGATTLGALMEGGAKAGVAGEIAWAGTVCAGTGATAAVCAGTGLGSSASLGGTTTATTTAGRTGEVATGVGCGCDAAIWSACLRSRIARATSPGLDARERSTLGLLSAEAETARENARLPPLRCVRTRAASSSSMELECVFFSVTPTAVSASRISLLLTSSSRARSLIRTLLIRPRYSVALC